MTFWYFLILHLLRVPLLFLGMALDFFVWLTARVRSDGLFCCQCGRKTVYQFRSDKNSEYSLQKNNPMSAFGALYMSRQPSGLYVSGVQTNFWSEWTRFCTLFLEQSSVKEPEKRLTAQNLCNCYSCSSESAWQLERGSPFWSRSLLSLFLFTVKPAADFSLRRLRANHSGVMILKTKKMIKWSKYLRSRSRTLSHGA